MASSAKKIDAKLAFKAGEYVVYPTHGVGLVTGVEKETIAGQNLRLVVVTFDNDRMTLRVPTDKMDSSGLRKVSSKIIMDDAVTTLKGKAKVKRTMWSRRAQEYEAKINSGDPISIAEVVRDLFRNVGQPDQSFSERQIYEVALERLAGEFAAVDGVDKEKATEKIETVLQAV
jgi:CarD family transcriptional regulator